jgi:hypothetical protein
MNRNRIAVVVLSALLYLACLPVYGQDAGNGTPPSRAKEAQKPTANSVFAPLTRHITPLKIDKKTVGEVAAILTKESGILVLADSTVAATPISFTVDSLPVSELADGIAKLNPGISVRFLALPVDIATPDPDLVVQLLRVEEAIQPLKGRPAGGKSPVPQTYSQIEVAGRTINIAQAELVMTTLKLRPVILLTNPTVDNPVAKSARLQAEGLQAYLGMTPEQRIQAIDQQMNNLLNMDSATRRALFGQMQQQGMAVLKKINALPPEQRAQFFRDLTGDKWDGTAPPAAQGAGGTGNGQP